MEDNIKAAAEEKEINILREKTFREIMERHKRVDGWIAAGLLTVLFFYSLWLHNIVVSLTF
jgi:hypothetical protein